MSLRLSVVMVTFNGATFLAEQFRSILNQSPPPYELIIADDGSTDSTIDVIRDAINDAAFPVRLIDGPHLGLRGNIERALSLVRGDVVVLSDQDDVWMPGRLLAISGAFASPATSLWASDADLIDDDGALLGSTLWDLVELSPADRKHLTTTDDVGLRRLLQGATLTGATMAFRASVLQIALPLPKELDPPGHLFLHDGWIAVLAALVGNVCLDPAKRTQYRRHSGQVTAQWSHAPVSTPSEARIVLRRDAARARIVRDRIVERSATDQRRPEDIILLNEYAEWLAVRGSGGRFSRIRAIINQLRRGRYKRYARGARTALSDIVMTFRIPAGH